MRSLRLFFADPECTSGQLVVASRESQYKILHFHHGGLDRLATTLHQWHQLLNPTLNVDDEETLPYRCYLLFDFIGYIGVKIIPGKKTWFLEILKYSSFALIITFIQDYNFF